MSRSLGAVLLIAIVAAFAIGWNGTIAAIAAPSKTSFEPALIRRGTELAAIGNCAGCHTTVDGLPYAGGVPLRTPFGTVHGTNLTPDPDTGIGTWSQAAFVRAMRQGLSRDGRHLYPAFPYDHFAGITNDDLSALYAFVMTRDPVRAVAVKNDLHFPFNIRPLVAGWNLLFLDRTPASADTLPPAALDTRLAGEWKRGAYLATTLGHCSACHSPRNALGAEDRHRFLDGGEADGWYAPAINAASPSPIPWDVDHLARYLRTGLVADHAMAGGPMQGVVGSLAEATEADVHAIAVYVVSMMGTPTPDRLARAAGAAQRAAAGPLASRQGGSVSPADDAALLRSGGQVYADSCAACHDAGRQVASSGALRLPLAVAVYDPDPRSLIRIVREGIMPADGGRGRWMPPFAGSLTDEQTVALLAYLRHQAADAPAWPDLAQRVKEAHSK